jgi:dipeptidase
VEANNRRIGNIDLTDSDNYLGSDDIIDFAIENGFWNPEEDIPFSCAKVYSNRGENRYGIPAPKYNTRRIWRGITLLSPSSDLDPEDDYFPLFVKPDKKLTPKDLLMVLRDHYQGTKYDLYAKDKEQYKYYHDLTNKDRHYQLSPSWQKERPIGISRSVTNWVAQLRDWMPNPIGGVLWGGIAAAWATAHIPWYVGITKTPEPYNIGTNVPGEGGEYEEGSAYWTFETVTNLVNLFYRGTIDMVLPVWLEWEDDLFKMQSHIEKTANSLYEVDEELAKKYLTGYSNSKGLEALDMAKDMIPKLITRIARHCTAI